MNRNSFISGCAPESLGAAFLVAIKTLAAALDNGHRGLLEIL